MQYTFSKSSNTVTVNDLDKILLPAGIVIRGSANHSNVKILSYGTTLYDIAVTDIKSIGGSAPNSDFNTMLGQFATLFTAS